MKKLVSAFLLTSLLAGSAFAQKEKLDDFDEIVIKKKGSNGKVALKIDINDDDVLINGKPLSSFLNDDVSVKIRKKKLKNGDMQSGTQSFSFGGDDNMDLAEISSDRPMLGVVTIENEKGAQIEEVSEGSAAEKVGMKEGDIITKVNEDAIKTPDQLSKTIGKYKPKEEVSITYLRDGKAKTEKVVLGARKAMGQMKAITPQMGQNFDLKSLKDMFQGFGDNFKVEGFGNNFNTLEPRPKIGINGTDIEDGKGVKIVSITEGSPAAKAGFKVGDIITEMDNDPVFTTKDIQKMTRFLKEGQEIKVKYSRAGKEAETKILIPKKIDTIEF